MITPSLEAKLHSAEYTLLRYRLRLQEDVCLPPFALLRLRRELSRLFKSGLIDATESEIYRQLLQPPQPVDPVIRRRVQQPAPAFILIPGQCEAMHLMRGNPFCLDVCFFGQGILQIKKFSLLLQCLGEIGLYANGGRFCLEAIDNACSFDREMPLWTAGPFELTPQILDLSELVSGSVPSAITLQFESPARLLSNGRPLFKADFVEMSPFLLRRVTGMCAAWAGVEDGFDVALLLEGAAQVKILENRLNWCDWRPLSRNEEVGGLLGTLTLEGQELFDLWPILKIGELLGLGKGAAFGAGRYRLLEPV